MKKESTFMTIHPGIVLKQELNARGISNKEFASTLSMPAPVLSDLINGKRSITPDIAILLEATLGRDAAYWLSLQSNRDIEVAKKKEEFKRKQQDIESWKDIQNYCNVHILEKTLSGGLGKNIHEKIDNVYEFFEVKDNIELRDKFLKDIAPSYFRKSTMSYDPVNMFTWKYLAFAASDKADAPIGIFKRNNLDKIVARINGILFCNKNTCENLKQALEENGIKFVILPNQQGTHIDGFSFWRGKWPTITLTLRGQKLDILAFTLLHEIYHVFNHLCENNQEKTCISIDGDKNSLEEKEADAFAIDHLIPPRDWQLFMAINAGISPYMIRPKLLEFSKRHGIHPSIVLGRYQHDYNVFDNGRGIERSIN